MTELGHLGGDRILQATADAMVRVLRPGDTAYHYGGEEFVVLMLLTAPPEALVAAERIRRAIEDLRIPDAGNTPFGSVTMSVGVTSLGPGELAADDDAWLARADAAMYRAKANGRNRCEVDSWSSPDAAGGGDGGAQSPEGSAAEAM